MDGRGFPRQPTAELDISEMTGYWKGGRFIPGDAGTSTRKYSRVSGFARSLAAPA